MRRSLLLCATALCAVTAMPAKAAPWTRSFVVGAYEYAFRYGGRAGYARDGEIEPGVDCPHGSTFSFGNPDWTRRVIAMQAWRTPKEIAYIIDPPGADDTNSPSSVRFHTLVRAAAYRGYKRGIETFVNPFAAEDPGEPEINSRIGDGFNLDGKISAKDFVSPEGERGIDNALYRAWGCDAPWRGNGNANLDLRANDKVQAGLYTMVIRITGNKDPMNDDNAQLEIGYSPDKIVKDSNGNVAADYSYRLVKAQPYSVLKATVKNGVIETQPVAELHAPRLTWTTNDLGDADFHQGRIRLIIGNDGRATGLMGGYRDWRDLYAENTFAQDGGQQGVREHEDDVALYYALKRNADGMADARTGQFLGISTAYRLKAAPAYVIDTDLKTANPSRAAEQRGITSFAAIRAAMLKGLATRVPQDVPPGTTEASVPTFEKYVADIPHPDPFYAAMDRPHYPWGDYDRNGNPLDAEGKPLVLTRKAGKQVAGAAAAKSGE
jgi:hypothetical protein